MPKSIISMNKVAQTIAEKYTRFSVGDIYGHLREMVTSGVLELEGVNVFTQETKQGNYGITYHFDNCEKVVEIWETLQVDTTEATATSILQDVQSALDNSKQLRMYFPNWLARKIMKFLADRK